MAKVQIRDKKIYVDDTPIPLLSGEVHYWRLAPARWREILERVREMGISAVATYICWEYHEYERGKFDFTGQTEPQRNLVGFLDLLQEMGFWIIIRPGPYIYSEWKNSGVPDYIASYHRLSPEYQDAARVWMEQVTNALKPYFATNGGRIIAFQPDNEMDLFTHWFEDEMGFRENSGLFQEFLKERYETAEKLNDAWRTSYDSIDQAQVISQAPFAFDASGRVAEIDYWRFQHWAVAKCIKWHADTYKKFGVDIPVFHNYYPGGDVQNWREESKVVDFTGIDVYPANGFERPAYPPTHREFMDVLRYQRSFSPIPYIAEFECGVWHGYETVSGTLSPNHYRLTGCSALAAGIAAWNWYMLVGRDNWYFTPIQEWGRIRGDLYEIFRDVVRVYNEIDPTSLEKLTDTAVIVDPVHVASDKSFRSDPVLEALYDADVDYETFDLETGKVAKPLAFYSGAQWLARADQERLVSYVESGGTLVCFKNFPHIDETISPCNLLGIRKPDRILSPLGKRVEVDLESERPVAYGSVFEYKTSEIPGVTWINAAQTIGPQQLVENSDILAINYQGKEFTIGYVEKRGKGRIVVIGLDPNPELVSALHGFLGYSTYARALAAGVHTALFRRGNDLYLIAANLGQDQTTPVTLSGTDIPSGKQQLTDMFTGEVSKVDIDMLTVMIGGKSGGVWKIG